MSPEPVFPSKKADNKITKELAMFLVPLAAAYLFITFYEAGYSAFFGIPLDLISVNITQVLLTNRLTLMVAVIAFLWIGLYYNILPSTSSPFFKGMISVILILSFALGIAFGRSDAASQKNFLVSNTEPEQAVLRIYNNTIISASFDRNNKTVFKTFSIRPIDQSNNILFHNETIGPLTPQ
ncbi:MAG: hypothetical protein ACD_62C00453G0001 [uncultured bacterium]|nr:MAG: hypothetical protein ACD_62C00453G0001 [uncultured bacterium]HLD45736.1 hypothetical protein [bacterium]